MSPAAFREIPLPAPEVVMFEFTERFVDDPCVVRVTGPTAEITADVVIVDPVEVMETPPPDEFMAAPLFVNAPEPIKVMSPVASSAPVSVTALPPVTLITPFEAVRDAEPA